MALKNRAVFLDRDGTIIEGVPYLSKVSQIKLNLNAPEGIRLINEKRYHVIVITNQSGIARGFFDETTLMKINMELKNQLLVKEARIDDIFFCPHMPASEISDNSKPCKCRKPKPKMILDAAEKYNINLNESFMVGDTPGDINAGKNAGCRTMLIDKGPDYYDYKRDIDKVKPDFIVKDLIDVANIIGNQLGEWAEG